MRREQRAVFADLARQRFEKDLRAFLGEHFPERCAELGDEGLRDIVSHSIARGARYGFVSEQQVCLFATLLLTLGRDLEEDRTRRWARRILNDPSYHYPDQRLDALYDEAERREPSKLGADEGEETLA